MEVCVTRVEPSSYWYPDATEQLKPVAPRRVRLEAVPDGEDESARQALELRIAQHVPDGRLALAVTDNRYTMISVKREKGMFRLRLHHMFLHAEDEVVRAL